MFSEATLAKELNSIETLRANPEVASYPKLNTVEFHRTEVALVHFVAHVEAAKGAVLITTATWTTLMGIGVEETLAEHRAAACFNDRRVE